MGKWEPRLEFRTLDLVLGCMRPCGWFQHPGINREWFIESLRTEFEEIFGENQSKKTDSSLLCRSNAIVKNTQPSECHGGMSRGKKMCNT